MKGPIEHRSYRSAIVDRYLLALVLKPFALAVGVLLLALLLGRVLRLVNILAVTGNTEYGVLAILTASLVPHYLGLALSAAFVVAVFVAMIRLGDASEIDALMASGVSLWRVAIPYMYLGGALAAFSLILYGYLNPISRYDYRRILYTAVNSVTHTELPPGTFVNAGNGVTITADSVDQTGRKLTGVFIHQNRKDGDRITTARTGQIVVADDGEHLNLVLEDGTSLRQNAGQAPIITQFGHLNFGTELNFSVKPFRARGNDEREMTIPELWNAWRTPSGEFPAAGIQAELIDRIVRPLSLPFMPLVAIPLSLASRRGSRTTGLVFAAILLVTFNNALQLGKEMAASGYGIPVVTAMLPFVAFVVLSVWLFASGLRHPTEAPLVRFVTGLSVATGAVTRRMRLSRRPA